MKASCRGLSLRSSTSHAEVVGRGSEARTRPQFPEPRLLQDCDTVGFHVLVNMSVANDVLFFPKGNMRAGTAYDASDFAPCAEPPDRLYDQKCGVEWLPYGEVPHESTGNCDPNCDTVTGICRCREPTTGSCTCVLAKRFTMQPSRFAGVGDSMSVCFNATSRRTPPLPSVGCMWPRFFPSG